MWYLMYDPDDSEESYIITEFIDDKPCRTTRWKPTAEICSTTTLIRSESGQSIERYSARFTIVHSTETLEEMEMFILMES